MLASPEQWAKSVKSVVKGVRHSGYEFVVAVEFEGAVTLRVRYYEGDAYQFGRPWIIEFGCHPIQIVQTCFLALMTSIEHRVREEFTWQGLPIMHPARTEREAVDATRDHLERRRGHEEHQPAPPSVLEP